MKKLQFLFLLLIALVYLNNHAFAQCVSAPDDCGKITITMPPDTAICTGTSFFYDFTGNISISPDLTVTNWAWTSTGPGGTVTPASPPPPVPGPTTFSPLVNTTYTLNISALGPNIIQNGNFSAGDVCFASPSYFDGTGTSNAAPAGNYAITTNVSLVTPAFWGLAMTDHTTGTGNMMVVNGTVAPNSVVWKETVNVCPCAQYQFSAWYANWSPPAANPPVLFVRINANTYGPFSAAGFDSWHLINFTWPGDCTGAATIQIIDATGGAVANDFALDDISFCRIATATGSFNITLKPAPVIAPYASPNSVCSGQPFNLYSGAAPCPGSLGCPYTFNWHVGPGTGTLICACDGPPAPIVTTIVGVSSYYTVEVTNSYGCTTTGVATENVVPPPIAGTVTCPRNFCANDPVSYNCTVTGNNTAGTWSITGGGTDITIDPVSGVIWVNPLLTGVTTVTACYIVSSVICDSSDTACCSFTVYPAPVFTISGPTDVCSGVSYTLCPLVTSGLGAGLPTYLWSTLATTSCITDMHSVIYGTSYPYSLTITNIWGCSSTATASVNVWPLPVAGKVKCPGNFCANDRVSYFCSVTGYSSLGTWSITGGGTDVTIDPVTGAIYVNPLLTTATTVTACYVVSSVLCGNDTACCSFTVYPAPAPITGIPAIICTGSVYPVSDVVPGGTWSTSDPTIANLGYAHTSGEVVLGVSGGAATITYTLPDGCYTTTTIYVDSPATACVYNFDEAPGYPTTGGPYVNFYTSCGGGSVLFCQLKDWSGTPLGYFTTSPGVLPYSYLYSLPGCSTAYYLCVDSVLCNSCYWPLSCCINLNAMKKSGSTNNSTALSNNTALTLLPNPNNGTFTLKGSLSSVKTSKVATIEVLDMLGKTLYTDVATIENGGINKNITLGNNIANGVYLVKIKNEEVNEVIKFTLER